MLASSKHLLNCNDNMSWIDVSFLNQNPWMPSWPGVFYFVTCLSITLSESRCMFSSGSSFSLYNSFFMLFIHLAFLICSILISCSNFFLFPLYPVNHLSLHFFHWLGKIFIRYFRTLFILLDPVSKTFKSSFFFFFQISFDLFLPVELLVLTAALFFRSFNSIASLSIFLP